MSNLEIVTKFNTGLNENFRLLKSEGLYNSYHNGSYFKYLYDQLDNGYNLNQSVTSVIAFDEKTNNPIGVLLYFHQIKDEEFKVDYLDCLNAGTIGVYVKTAYRGQGIAKKLFREMENNFIPLYSYKYDYIVINTLEDAYQVGKKTFEWFIPSHKQNCQFQNIADVRSAVGEGKRTLNYHRYNQSKGLY